MKSSDVEEVCEKLINQETGFLALKNIGIGRPLHRSKLFALIISVDAIESINAILCNGNPFETFALNPTDSDDESSEIEENDGGEFYFDVMSGSLKINGINCI